MLNDNYKQMYESESPFINELNLNSQLTHKSKFTILLSKYDKIFSKSKYNVSKIKMEPQSTHLLSEPFLRRNKRTNKRTSKRNKR